MNRRTHLGRLAAVLFSIAITLPSLSQEKDAPKKDAKPATGQASEADMMAAMTELAKPGDNHKLLARTVGSWTYKVKMYMIPGAPMESSGTMITREVMGGRYFVSDHTGTMQMPGADGKMTDMEFKGMAIDGYDNVKKKFVSSWIDNMGTSILVSEGDYDAATKTLTYHAEEEQMPGMKTKVRAVVKITDKDHHTLEWYEDRGGTDFKMMEIAYTRKT
jgi:hypothetical protein